jgi:hypothetical protein
MPILEMGLDDGGVWLYAAMMTESITGSKTFSIQSDGGTATGTVVLPDAPTVATSPNEGDTVNPGSDIVFTWSSDASYHSVYVNVYNASYSDVALADTVVTGNSFTLAGNKVLATHERVYFSVWSWNGVDMRPGATANMTGSALGFLIADNQTGEYDDRRRDLYVRGSSLGKRVSEVAFSSAKTPSDRSARRRILARYARELLGN